MVGRCYSRSLRLDGDSVKSTLDSVGAKPVKLSSMKPGRNDPCRCGSGKKYKQCYLGRDGASNPGTTTTSPPIPSARSRVWAENAVESQRH
jgi:SEC-C motif